MDKSYMNLLEVADYLRVSPSSISKLRSHRKIPFTKVGHRLIFVKHKIDKWMSGRTVFTPKDETKFTGPAKYTKVKVMARRA